MLSRLSIRIVGLAAACLAVSLSAAVPRAQAPAPVRGAATPQEAVALAKKAMTTNDFTGVLPVLSPAGLKRLASDGVTGLMMVLAFSDPDDPMPGSSKPSKAELDAQRKKYKDALDLSKQTLKPYGLDTMIGKPVLAADTQKTINAAIDKADALVMVTSLFDAMKKIGPMLGMKENPKPLVEVGTVTGYKITGDKATAQNGPETLQFSRIAGRWYLEPPPEKGSANAGPDAQSSGGGQGRDAGAAPAASRASGTQPEIVVGGIQVAKVIVPGDDFSAKPFHSDNGTRIVLWVKMPATQGLIALDEDASVLQVFGDDKGTDLGGKFGSFPEVFKDGTGGTIEIESSGIVSAAAGAIVAEGTLAMTVASGTRKTRVANVRLANDQKFLLGQTSITLSEVGTEGESQTFTLKLPRQVMTGIKDVAFFDAKGAPLDSHRSGSGYMNDDAEMSFSVKTAAKTLTMEFEAWQGQRTVKTPFKVRAGLGLGR